MNLYNTSSVQLYPSRITITNHYINNAITLPKTVQTYCDNFKAVKNPFIISKASKKKIFDTVNSMYALSPPRKILMKNKNFLYNFRLSFITLTLPSKQEHSDIEIKKQCLNQFLVEIRKHYGVQNYLWKAELQKNKNIHFHLILDKYIDYQALRRRWNRCISKLGYIAAYSNKFQNINLSQYHAMRNLQASCSFEKSKAAFAAGQRSKWSNPNSVDIRSVLGKRDLAIYLSKYIAKQTKSEDKTDAQLERELSFGRSWSRSESLSKLKYQNKLMLSEVLQEIKYLKNCTKFVKHVVGDFFEAFYFNISEMPLKFRNWLQFYLNANARLYQYPFPC